MSCFPFEGRFHSIDFSFSTWTLRAWTPSMTVHPHFKHCVSLLFK